MNKNLGYILIFVASSLFAQIPTDTVFQGVDTLVYGEIEEAYSVKESISFELLSKDTLEINQRKFSPHYKEKYTDSDFVYSYERRSEKSGWDRFLEMIRNFFSIDFNPSIGSVNTLIQVLKLIAYLGILAIVILLVRYIILNDVHLLFSKNPKKSVNIHDLENNIHEVDFDLLINDAVERKQHRFAIRYHFLRLLKAMSEKQIIDWHPDKTNREYLHEISSQQLKEDFDYLTYVYENIWYGEFEITEESFGKIAQKFNHTIRQLP